MKMLLFHFLKLISFLLHPIRHGYYIRVLQYAYELQGVKFRGNAKFIHSEAFIDNIGKISIGSDLVISTKAIILAHDYSPRVFESIGKYTKRDSYVSSVKIGNNVFIGACAIILPDSNIGDNCIIGAGCVVKGVIPNNSIVVGNPCKIIKTIL